MNEKTLGIQELLIKQKVTPSGLERIKRLHREHKQILAKIKSLRAIKSVKENSNSSLKVWATAADASMVEIQKAWNYPINPYYHKFWTLPHCKCPTEDNEKKWPKGPYEYDTRCPLHGDRIVI